MGNRSTIWKILVAFSAPIFLGMAPILGKMAINGGAEAFTVAALRTTFAASFLWVVYFAFFRKYIYISPAGLFGCVVMGLVNGLGSLFYYSGLGMLDASLAQLLNGMYLVFVILLARIGGAQLERRLQIRVLLAVAALVIITGAAHTRVSGLGIGLMIANALMFGGTMIISQFVLYEVPAPTVTLYSLTTMAGVVVVVWLAVGKPLPLDNIDHTLVPIIFLAMTTALSRLALFAGVKFLGGLQTAVLSLTEIGATLLMAFFLLGDRLTLGQVAGVALLVLCISLFRQRDLQPLNYNKHKMNANLPELQWQWIAFSNAFGTHNVPESDSKLRLTTTEMVAIRVMMGVESSPVAPIKMEWDATHDQPTPAPVTMFSVPTIPSEYPDDSNSESMPPI